MASKIAQLPILQIYLLTKIYIADIVFLETLFRTVFKYIQTAGKRMERMCFIWSELTSAFWQVWRNLLQKGEKK